MAKMLSQPILVRGDNRNLSDSCFLQKYYNYSTTTLNSNTVQVSIQYSPTCLRVNFPLYRYKSRLVLSLIATSHSQQSQRTTITATNNETSIKQRRFRAFYGFYLRNVYRRPIRKRDRLYQRSHIDCSTRVRSQKQRRAIQLISSSNTVKRSASFTHFQRDLYRLLLLMKLINCLLTNNAVSIAVSSVIQGTRHVG